MPQWIIDPDHSVAAFKIRHMTICHVHGQFNRISGSISFDPEGAGDASVDASIDVASIYTGIAKRDEHLKSADFFDAANCPSITFRSTAVEKIGASKLRIRGNLCIHAITREVAFDAEISGPVKSPFGDETTIGFSASLTINRHDFGISWNELMEGGGLVVGKQVEISLELEADLKG